MKELRRYLKIQFYCWLVAHSIRVRLSFYNKMIYLIQSQDIQEIPLLLECIKYAYNQMGFKPEDQILLPEYTDYDEMVECDGIMANGESFSHNDNMAIYFNYLLRVRELATLRIRMLFRWWYWIPLFGFILCNPGVIAYNYQERERTTFIGLYILYQFIATITIVGLFIYNIF